jgi:hypothetical protein
MTQAPPVIADEATTDPYTVIHFRPKLRKILRFPLNRNFGMSFGSLFKPEVSVPENYAKNS